MPKKDWIENNIEKIFRKQYLYPEQKISSVLDVACGISFKSQYIEADIRVGVDIFRPYLENIELERKVPFVTVNADVLELDTLFLPKSFDIVLLLDIIEHLEKNDSIGLIAMAETIAKVAVIVETPKGYIPQNIDILGYEGHEYQTHRCGWEIRELEEMGFKTFVREYVMSDNKRHTKIKTDTKVELIDAIKYV